MSKPRHARRLALISLLLLLRPISASAAVGACTTGNNGANNGGSTTSVTWNFDAVGSCTGNALLVQVEGDTNTDDVTGVTYNSVAMTLLVKVHAAAGRWTYTYGLLSPASGSNAIVVSASTSHYLFGVATSYAGVTGFGATATTTSSGSATIPGTITTTAANSWVYVGAAGSDVSSWSGVTNATLRGQYVPFSSPVAFDNNTAIAAGSYSMTISDGSSPGDIGMVLVELKAETVSSGRTYTVCASGCDYDNAHLQSALDVVVDNDTILLQSGYTYDDPGDGFILGPRCAVPKWDCIVVRTGVDATGTVLATALFPSSTQRVTTAYRGVLAKFVPHSNNEGSFRTIYPGETGAHGCTSAPCVGSGWTLQWIEFAPKPGSFNKALVRFGTNKAGKEWNGSCSSFPDPTPSCWKSTLPGGETQDTLVEIPKYLSLIQSDLHGDAVGGQFQGLLIASADTRLYRNWFSDIKSIGQETQAITALNGIGPVDIQNNHLEGAGETFLFGGSDTYLQLKATVTGSPTTTSLPLTSAVWEHLDGTTQAANLASDIYSGIFVSVTHGGVEYGGLICNLSGATCNLPTALPVTPSVGDVVRWCWLFGGLTMKYNHLYKPTSWMNPIIGAPTLSVPTAGAGGSLSASSHCYKIAARAFAAVASTVTSIASSEQCVTTAANGTASMSWTAVTGATVYRVFGNGTTGNETQYWDVTAPTTTYLDTGTAGTTGTPPTAGDLWVVKNDGELKHMDGASPAGPAVIEFNVFDNSWCCAQNMIFSMKTWNQGDGLVTGGDKSSTIRNVTVRNDWFRHGVRCINLTSSHAEDKPSGVMTDVSVENVLCSDLSSIYSNDISNPTPTYTPLQVTTGNYSHHVGSRGGVRITIKHVTFLPDTAMDGPFWFVVENTTDLFTDFIYKDNLSGREGSAAFRTFLNCCSNPGIGSASWTAATTGASSMTNNAWPDGSSGTYNTFSPNSKYPTNATVQSDLVSYAGCKADTLLSCVLGVGSALHLAASDGTDIGVNISPEMQAGIAIALSGDASLSVVGRPRVRWRIR